MTESPAPVKSHRSITPTRQPAQRRMLPPQRRTSFHLVVWVAYCSSAFDAWPSLGCSARITSVTPYFVGARSADVGQWFAMAEIRSAFFLPPWPVVPGPFREGASPVLALALAVPCSVNSLLVVRAGGLEPPRARPDGFSYPLRLSPPPEGVWGLDYPFTMLRIAEVRCCPSSLYTFPSPGLARDCQ